MLPLEIDSHVYWACTVTPSSNNAAIHSNRSPISSLLKTSPGKEVSNTRAPTKVEVQKRDAERKEGKEKK